MDRAVSRAPGTGGPGSPCMRSATTYKMQMQQPTFLVCNFLHFHYATFIVPAGVALYWITGNLLAVVQQILLNKAISPEKHVDYDALEKSKEQLRELEALDAQEDKAKARELAGREKKDEKRFFAIGGKHLVFYSEGQGFYKYFKPVIREILNNSDLTIHYITFEIPKIISSGFRKRIPGFRHTISARSCW